MPLVALHDRQAIAVCRRARPVLRVAIAVPVLWLGQPPEVVQEVPDGVGRRDEVGVEDHHVLGSRAHAAQRFLQRAALEALAAGAVDHPNAGMLFPLLEELDRLVGRVVGDDDFVVLIVERGAGFQEPVDDAFLVVQREVDRDEGLAIGGKTDLAHPLPGVVHHHRSRLGELLAAQGAVALSVLSVGRAVAAGLPIGLEAVAIRLAVSVGVSVATLEFRRIAEQRDQDDAGDGHVVLERIEEKEKPAEESEQRERKPRRQSIAHQEAEAADPQEHDDSEDRTRVQLAEDIPGPDHMRAAAAVPDPLEGVPDVVGGRGDASQAKVGMALRVGEGAIVEWIRHRQHTVSPVRGRDHKRETPREVERQQARRLALDRIDQAR